MIGGIFALAGVIVGVAHAGLLGRSASRSLGPASAPARLLLVSLVLVLAARAGQLMPCAGGWLVGFVGASAVLWRRLR